MVIIIAIGRATKGAILTTYLKLLQTSLLALAQTSNPCVLHEDEFNVMLFEKLRLLIYFNFLKLKMSTRDMQELIVKL